MYIHYEDVLTLGTPDENIIYFVRRSVAKVSISVQNYYNEPKQKSQKFIKKILPVPFHINVL